MATSDKAVAAAFKDAKDVLLDRVKSNAGLSLKLGGGTALVSFGVLTTLLALNIAISAGQDVLEGVKAARLKA